MAKVDTSSAGILTAMLLVGSKPPRSKVIGFSIISFEDFGACVDLEDGGRVIIRDGKVLKILRKSKNPPKV